MAAKYDAEDLLQTILEVMTTGDALNAKIAAIEAEKIAAGNGLTPGLSSIDSSAYHEQSWTNKILNTTPAIFYGIEEVQATDGGGVAAKLYTIFVEVVLVDTGQTNDIHRRVQRYARALEELFASVFAPALGHGAVKIQQVRPVSFQLALDSDDEVRVGGISLQVSVV